MSSNEDPLAGPSPTEIPLGESPLMRLIGQVRFGEILSMEEVIEPFQEAIREEYPTLLPETRVGNPPRTIWSFLDATGVWRASVAGDCLALEVIRSPDLRDFLGRFEVLLRALAEHVAPKRIDRIGIRFINRLVGVDLDALTSRMRPEVAGILGSKLVGNLRQTMTESLFELPDGAGQVLARWGRLPAGATADPAVIEPSDEESWVLDIDAFSARSQPFDVRAVAAHTRLLAERGYAMFRWAANDGLSGRCRGETMGEGRERGYPTAQETSADGRSPVWGGGLVCESPPTGSDLFTASGSLGGSGTSATESSAHAICKLRLFAGLTWDQLARLFGVSRRAVHFWASGKPMNAGNEERLRRVLEIVRFIDRGDAQSNRAALLGAVDGEIPFDLLVDGRLEEVRQFLGRGPGRRTLALKPLSEEARAARRPIPPAILADARTDRVHRDPGGGRAANTVRNKRRGRK
ncbi:MAG: TIGR04255 family protein [Planctomycetota bacterium]